MKPRGPAISDEKRANIRARFAEGMSALYISQKLKMDYEHVKAIVADMPPQSRETRKAHMNKGSKVRGLSRIPEGW